MYLYLPGLKYEWGENTVIIAIMGKTRQYILVNDYIVGLNCLFVVWIPILEYIYLPSLKYEWR